MKVIALRIPRDTSESEIRKVFEEYLSRKFRLPFTQKPEVRSVKIIEHEDPQQVKDFYGVVEVYPATACCWLLGHYQNLPVHGKRVFFREYFERRQHKQLDAFVDKRLGAKVHEVQHARVEGLANVRRKY